MSQMELRDRKKLKRRSEQGSSRRPTIKVPDSVVATTIEDLSPELLVKIFTHCIEVEGHMKFVRNVAPVCKTWWNLSSTPSLWKSIDLQDSMSVLSFSNGALYYTVAPKISYSCARDTDEGLDSLERDRLLGVLPHIRGVKSVEINNKTINVNTMATVAKHCPNLEQLHMKLVSRIRFGQITLEELLPILSTCGPKLKHLNFDCCEIGCSERLIAEIAVKCTKLEVLEWNNGCGYSKFPIDELVVGCPKLHKLALSKCELVRTGEDDSIKDLIVFKAAYCKCGGLDVCSFLRSSENLDVLELIFNENLIFSDPSKIPSNKVRSLFLQLVFLPLYERNVNFEDVEFVVNKWKHTLLHLQILAPPHNITSALRILLDSNPCPKLETLCVRKKSVDPDYLKVFIQKCQSLKILRFYENGNLYGNRREVLKLGDSL